MDARDQAIKYANEAVEHDRANRTAEAFSSYMRCLECFELAIKYEKNARVKATMSAKAEEFMARAEGLHAVLHSEGKRAKPKNDPQAETALSTPRKPLTEEELAEAEKEMEAELEKLVGMDSVKTQLRRMCKTLQLDIQRRKAGMAVLEPVKHMVFTGNPGTGKTTISRIVGSLFKRLGLSSNDHVVECQKGDLVAGYVNQTGAKTREKIKEAKGGVLFVDEAYQLTDALSRGQSDMGGEAIDEMMRVMNDTGLDAVTFIFAGYKENMQQFLNYNPGLTSRIRYTFHFDDYTPADLVKILERKLAHKGWRADRNLLTLLPTVIEAGTTCEQRSQYNGRLVDNLLQWAVDELNSRLPVHAKGDELVTLLPRDFQAAMMRFAASSYDKPIQRAVANPEVEGQLAMWGLDDLTDKLAKHGYRNVVDLLALSEADCISELGLQKGTPKLKRLLAFVDTLRKERVFLSGGGCGLPPPEAEDVQEFVDRLGCSEYGRLFQEHKVDYAALLLLTYEDLKEIGVCAVGPRRKIYQAIEAEREARRVYDALQRAGSVDSRDRSLGEYPTTQHLQSRLDRLKIPTASPSLSSGEQNDEVQPMLMG